MNAKLLFITFLISCYNYAQQPIPRVPETWENDLWDGANWMHFSTVDYIFNENCLPILIESEVLDFTSGQFVDSSRLTITYNSSNQPVESINELWNAGNGVWENTLRSVNIYNSENSVESQNFMWENNAWVLIGRVTETYDTNTMVLEVVHEDYDNSTSTYTNTDRSLSEFTNFDLLDNILDYEWDTVENEWMLQSRTSYTYNVNQLATKMTLEDWVNNTWVNDVLETFSYDANNFLIESLRSDWNSTTSSYDTATRQLITNDSEGNPTETITQTFQFGSWINASRDRRTYPTCSALSETEFLAENFKIYPVPASNILTIESKKMFQGYAELRDIRGRLISTEKLSNNSKIDISSLNSGVYLLTISSQEETFTKRIIKQ